MFNSSIRRGFVLTLLLTAVAAVVSAQTPPAVGPDSYRSDQAQIGVGILTGFVRTQLEKIITDTNAALEQRGTSVRVSMITPLRTYNPQRVATLHKHRPNEYYVKLPMNLGIKVSIPATSDRRIYYPLDLNVTCDQWHTGSGQLKVTAVTGPPSVEGGNILEDVFFIRGYIDNQVKGSLPRIGAITQSLPNGKCSTIGASSSGPADPFAFIAFDRPIPRAVVNTGGTVDGDRLEVTFLKLKRLAARGNGGNVLYAPTENVVVDLYANLSGRQTATLTLREGEEVPLNVTPVVFSGALRDILVIIGQVNQSSGAGEDSAFASALRSARYAPGEHILRIPKHYVRPAGPGNRKPTIIAVPAYELTYRVTFTGRPGVARPPIRR